MREREFEVQLYMLLCDVYYINYICCYVMCIGCRERDFEVQLDMLLGDVYLLS